MELHASHDAVTASSHISFFCIAIAGYWLPIAVASAGTFLLSRQCGIQSDFHCQISDPTQLGSSSHAYVIALCYRWRKDIRNNIK